MPDVADDRFISTSPDNPGCLIIQGDWVLGHYAELRQQVQRMRRGVKRYTQADPQQLGRLDTAGGQLLTDLLGNDLIHQLTSDSRALPEERRVLLTRIAESLDDQADPAPAPNSLFQMLGDVGRYSLALYQHV